MTSLLFSKTTSLLSSSSSAGLVTAKMSSIVMTGSSFIRHFLSFLLRRDTDFSFDDADTSIKQPSITLCYTFNTLQTSLIKYENSASDKTRSIPSYLLPWCFTTIRKPCLKIVITPFQIA